MVRKIRNSNSFPARFYLFIALLSILNTQYSILFAQSKEKEIVAVSPGAGILTFYGDVGSTSRVGDYSFIRRGFSLSFEKYFDRNFSLSLNLLTGKIARDEKASDNLPKLNFESPITQFGLSGTFLMQGKKEQSVIPFISAGFSLIQFNPHSDLLDKNGNPYYFWKDGSIRDLPDTGLNYFYAKNIERDYTYETKLKDSVNYPHSTFALPLSAGIKLKLTPRLDANIGFTYHLAFSDYLDNMKSPNGNDAYLFSSLSLTWHVFTLPKAEKEKISNIDFAGIDKTDADRDGAPDDIDLCPGTPKGAKTDSKGCPLDADADGVPDYADKEPLSKGGLPVDVNGVELTKERMSQIQKAQNGSAELHSRALSDNFNKKPSAEFMKEVELMQQELKKNPEYKPSNKSIPYDMRVADWNKDNFISADEIAKTIDAFFDGTITFSAEQINRLIDFFFEQ